MIKKIIAAVPNYNMASGLQILLPQLIKQQYDAIYVLDDFSTDNSIEVASKFKQVTVIKDGKNAGAGANRNRILNQVNDNTIIHFLDADVVLRTDDVIAKIRKLVKTHQNAIIGGKILHKSGHWHQYNFGPKSGASAFFGARIHELSVFLSRHGHNNAAKRIRNFFPSLTESWPDVTRDPVPKKVFWVTEGNLIVPAKLFKDMGGFDASLREHEILEFGMRLQQKGYDCIFDPEITVLHTALKVRPPFRLFTRGWYHLKVLWQERNFKNQLN